MPQLITGHHHTQLFLFVTIDKNIAKEAGAELGQAQVKLDDIIVIVVEVVVKAMVEVEVQLLFRVGGCVGGWAVG